MVQIEPLELPEEMGSDSTRVRFKLSKIRDSNVKLGKRRLKSIRLTGHDFDKNESEVL